MAEVTFGVLKWCLFIFNALFAVLGLALLITASVVLADTKDLLGDYGEFAWDEIKGPAGLMVFVGLVMFAVAAVGALAAIRENRCLILTFASLIAFLVVLEFGGSIAAYVYRNEVRDVAEKRMRKVVLDYWNTTAAAQSAEWDVIQKDLQCCGVHGPKDFDPVKPPIVNGTSAIPGSCCDKTTGAGRVDGETEEDKPAVCAKDDPKLHKKGCLDKIVEQFRSNLGTIGGFGLALLFIQVFGILAGCFFSSALRKRYGSSHP